MFKNLKLRNKLKKVGAMVDTSYLCYVNNDEPRQFETQQDCYNYLKEYRSNNVIFSIKIFRIETYSL